jgi:RecB family exonuclease
VELALSRLLELESGRSAFSVEAVEREVHFVGNGVSLKARVDRMDRLASGDFAIIDYKTGATGTTPHWFDEDHADYQMPLYAVASEQAISALVLCSLTPEKCEYRGFWIDDAAFPQRSVQSLDARQWGIQLDDWRAEIEALVYDFVAGDATVFADAIEPALGMYAPLTRLAEVFAEPTSERSP